MRLELDLQLGGGRDPERQLLLDLGRVPVRGDLVGDDVLAGHRQVGGLVERPPGAGDALLGVDHDVGDQPGAGERREREQRRGRVAARVGDDRGAGDLLAVQLGQPVDGLAEQLRARVLAVPALVASASERRRKSALRSTTRAPRSRSAATVGRGGGVRVGDDRGVDAGERASRSSCSMLSGTR